VPIHFSQTIDMPVVIDFAMMNVVAARMCAQPTVERKLHFFKTVHDSARYTISHAVSCFFAVELKKHLMSYAMRVQHSEEIIHLYFSMLEIRNMQLPKLPAQLVDDTIHFIRQRMDAYIFSGDIIQMDSRYCVAKRYCEDSERLNYHWGKFIDAEFKRLDGRALTRQLAVASEAIMHHLTLDQLEMIGIHYDGDEDEVTFGWIAEQFEQDARFGIVF